MNLLNRAAGRIARRNHKPIRVLPVIERLIYGSGIGGARFSSAQHAGSIGPALVMAKRGSANRL
jgi:hypothetical protein